MSDEVQTEVFCISYFTSLCSSTRTPQMSGGQKLDEFVTNHFAKTGEKNPRTDTDSLSIVPHAGEVERLFSNLGHIQGVRHCNLSVSHMQTLGSFRNYYQGVVDKKKKESGQSTRRKHVHMHTREGGGINPQKVADLTKNWTIQSPLTSRGKEGEEDIELIGLEDITAEELDAEFNRLQLMPSDPQNANQQQVRPLPCRPPTQLM
jgi:hypothetical protein